MSSGVERDGVKMLTVLTNNAAKPSQKLAHSTWLLPDTEDGFKSSRGLFSLQELVPFYFNIILKEKLKKQNRVSSFVHYCIVNTLAHLPSVFVKIRRFGISAAQIHKKWFGLVWFMVHTSKLPCLQQLQASLSPGCSQGFEIWK